ncbi:MAG: glycoside hydrolase family 32 protein [Culicoidibacterales bacterium]
MTATFENVAALSRTIITEPNRLNFHIQPPVGLLNDPNGLVQHNGVYHVFYQWNPLSCEHKNKTWNHLTTTNFVEFTQHSVALMPTDWYDKNGCYSGSGFVKDDQIYLFYTGNVKDAEHKRQSYQCLAKVLPNQHVEKLGVVIDDSEIPEGYTRHFRDPKIWFDQSTQKWVAIFGAQTQAEKGTALLFVSDDAIKWEFHGELQTEYTRNFGFMWECPDLLQVDGQDVFIFSPQGIEQQGIEYANIYQSGYVTGNFDLATCSFTHDTFVELDRGFEFYAPQTFNDEQGRTIMIAWMGLPEEEAQPTCEHGWVHALTIPRQLQVRDGVLYQTPLEEFAQLRGTKQAMKIGADEAQKLAVAASYELQFACPTMPTTGVMTIDFDGDHTLTCDFEQGIVTLTRRGAYLPGIRQCRLDATHVFTMTIFKDTSSVEIFLQGGSQVFTARTFHEQPVTTLTIATPHGLQATYWELGKMTITQAEMGNKE